MERARKAYWRGASAARRGSTHNPYANDKLADLWIKGRAAALDNPSLAIPAKFGQRHEDKQRPPTRPARRKDPRDFDRGGGRGGW
jgi:hypothetical protein